jgi:molybdopterin molybdotransferase
MLELEDALQKILTALPPPVSERAALREAAGRVLAENISSSVDLPPFDNSAMDGYAVRAVDVECATLEVPVCLRLRGKVAAGEMFAGEISRGQCVRLFTGSPLPRGADAVVMQEDTRVDSAHPDEVLIRDAAKPWENVRRRGTDVTRGTMLAEAGEVLTAGRISLLAASGITGIETGKRPRVGLLATGSELREAGQTLAPGQI